MGNWYSLVQPTMLYLLLALAPAGCQGHGCSGRTTPGDPVDVAVIWTTAAKAPMTAGIEATDLDGDGVQDILTGTEIADSVGMLALSGQSGAVLWHTTLAKGVGGSYVAAPVIATDPDGSPLILAGGGFGDFVALDMRGRILWTLRTANPDSALSSAVMFHTPALARGADGSTTAIAIVHSGTYGADRPPGALLLVDPATGRLNASLPVPAGAESYAAPVSADRHWLLGTGGETRPGGLVAMDAGGRVHYAVATTGPRGVMAAPLLCTDADGGPLVIALDFFGRLFAAADDGRLRWSAMANAGASYTQPVPVVTAQGSQIVALRAELDPADMTAFGHARLDWHRLRDGRVTRSEDLEGRSSAAPLVADLRGNGEESVLALSFHEGLTTIHHFHSQGRDVLHRLSGFTIATPLLSDLDGDGVWDLVVATSDGVTRLAFGRARGPARWPAFRGPERDGRAACGSAIGRP